MENARLIRLSVRPEIKKLLVNELGNEHGHVPIDFHNTVTALVLPTLTRYRSKTDRPTETDIYFSANPSTAALLPGYFISANGRKKLNAGLLEYYRDAMYRFVHTQMLNDMYRKQALDAWWQRHGITDDDLSRANEIKRLEAHREYHLISALTGRHSKTLIEAFNYAIIAKQKRGLDYSSGLMEFARHHTALLSRYTEKQLVKAFRHHQNNMRVRVMRAAEVNISH